MASESMDRMKVRAGGMFQGGVGWSVTCRNRRKSRDGQSGVENASLQEGELVLDLSQAPDRETRFSVTVWHGDNTPVKFGNQSGLPSPGPVFLADRVGGV